MRFLGFVLLIFPLFANGADIYGKHHLCLSNPSASYMTGDALSAYPSCSKEYAVIHVPTFLSEDSVKDVKIQSLETDLSTCKTQIISNQTLCSQQTSFYQSTSIFGGTISKQDIAWFYGQLFSLAMIVFSGVVLRAVLITF